MTFKDIAAVSGKPGLYKILKPTRSGVILESLDDLKKKFVAGVNIKVSVLQEISIYTTDEEGIIGLPAVMKRINDRFTETIPVDQKSDGAALTEFLEQIVDNFDREKVYTSDIRKLVAWYIILKAREPQIFDSDSAEETTENNSVVNESSSDQKTAELQTKVTKKKTKSASKTTKKD